MFAVGLNIELFANKKEVMTVLNIEVCCPNEETHYFIITSDDIIATLDYDFFEQLRNIYDTDKALLVGVVEFVKQQVIENAQKLPTDIQKKYKGMKQYG